MTHHNDPIALERQLAFERGANFAQRFAMSKGEYGLAAQLGMLIAEADTFVLANIEGGIESETSKSQRHVRLAPRLNQV